MRRLSLALSVAALPAQVEHGRLVGQLDDATLAARVGVSVSAQRQGAEGRWARVGADGTFALDLPPGDYDADPFSHHDLMAAQLERMQGIALRNDRAFEFAWLAAGDYVVRIVGGGALARRIVAHRCLHADGRGVVDLGDLAKAEPIDTALDCGPRPAMEYGPAVSVQALPPDGLAAVFWQSSFVRHGRLDLAGIHPGRYRLQRFEPQHFAGTWGLLGPALGAPVEIEVGADGKVTPARVF